MEKILVYDIDSFVKSETEQKYEAFRYEKAAIFCGARGVVFAEAEAVHKLENKMSDSIELPIAPVPEKGKMYVAPTHDLIATLEEIVEKAPREEMYLEEFFSRRNYNPRCQDNYAELMRSLRKIGFDVKPYLPGEPSVEDKIKEASTIREGNSAVGSQDRELKAAEKQKSRDFKPDCPLIGQDGNIFNLMAIASRTLRENGLENKAIEMREKIQASGSYDKALCILGEYVNIVSKDARSTARDER